jgi:hypothetical protein
MSGISALIRKFMLAMAHPNRIITIQMRLGW